MCVRYCKHSTGSSTDADSSCHIYLHHFSCAHGSGVTSSTVVQVPHNPRQRILRRRSSRSDLAPVHVCGQGQTCTIIILRVCCAQIAIVCMLTSAASSCGTASALLSRSKSSFRPPGRSLSTAIHCCSSDGGARRLRLALFESCCCTLVAHSAPAGRGTQREDASFGSDGRGVQPATPAVLQNKRKRRQRPPMNQVSTVQGPLGLTGYSGGHPENQLAKIRLLSLFRYRMLTKDFSAGFDTALGASRDSKRTLANERSGTTTHLGKGYLSTRCVRPAVWCGMRVPRAAQGAWSLPFFFPS